MGFLLLVLAIVFALSNRQSATVGLWPLGAEVSAPLSLLTLGSLFSGLLLGAVVGWASMLPHRLEARRLRQEMESLHRKLDALRDLSPSFASAPPQGKLTSRQELEESGPSRPQSKGAGARFFGKLRL